MKSRPIETVYGYKKTITKEELSKLPVEHFTKDVVVIERKRDCKPAFSDIEKNRIVGIDTESRPVFEKGHSNKISLMQISSESCCYLFRINKTGMTDEILSFLENPLIYKVGISLKDDIKAIRTQADVYPQKLLELQKLCPVYGIMEQGLQRIYAIIFGKLISKSQTLTNWNAKELSESQIKYAALDAWAALRIYNKLASLPNPRPANYAIIN